MNHSSTTKRTRRGAALAASTAILLTASGCAGEGAPERTVTVTKTVTTTATATATQSNSPADAPADLELGKTATLTDLALTVSQVEEATSPGSQLPSDQRWWSAMVEACSKADITLSWSAWSIQGEDGGTYPASNTIWGDFPVPQYPSGGDRVLRQGKCTKGWIMFTLSAGTTPSTVDYGNSVGENASWKAN